MKRALSLLLLFSAICAAQLPEPPLRIGIAGLAHGHVDGFFRAVARRSDVKIVGIFDPDTALHAKYANKYGFAHGIFFTALEPLLDQIKPDAIAAFTNTYDHAVIVEVAAKRKVPVMMEKPLAINMEHARRIERAASTAGIPIIVNYETTWYPSHAEMRRLLKDQGAIRRMVAMDGHQGPKEINVGPEFLGWLTDPLKNGAGALFDFGCYGANLMTWMLDNQRPLAVTAITHTNKPAIYSRVDDEATVLVQYPNAQGIIQGSWNWPFSRKDFEVYTEQAYAVATGGDILHTRLKGEEKEELRQPAALPDDEASSISYLRAVVRGHMKPSGLSSLENNMIVTEILEAARESAKTGKTIKLSSH